MAALADDAYVELRRAILSAGLLERARAYYFWRAGLAMLVLAAGVGAGLFLPPGGISLLLTSVLLTFGSVQVALIGHDAGHLAIFRGSRANFILGQVCWSLICGISFWYWCDRHNRHHASTNDVADDPDLQWGGLVAYSDTLAQARSSRTGWLTQHQTILGPLYALGLAVAFRVEGWRFTLQSLRGRRRPIEGGLLTLNVVGWALPMLDLGWYWVGVFLLTQILAGAYLALVVAPNHKGMPTWPAGTTVTFLERQVLSSRNIRPHPIGDFVFGGLNYQIEHHLFPTMPRVHFGRARAIVKAFCLARGLGYAEMGVIPSYQLVFSELRRVGRSSALLQIPRTSAIGPTVK